MKMDRKNTQAVVNRLYEFADYGLNNTCVFLLLDELILQFGYYTSSKIDSDQGIAVVNVKDIYKVMEAIPSDD